jgi:RNA-directed DNA polymerase
MSKLDQLRKCENLKDVSRLIGFKPSALAYILYKIPDDNKYTEFTVKKRGGGVRRISAPISQLKSAQKALNRVLNEVLAEYLGKNKKVVSHGFVPRQSIVTNADMHVGRRHVFNVDIADFFGSFNFGRVRGFFIHNKKFKMNPAAATVIAQIACHNNSLPQGSPSSPVITNLISGSLDAQLLRLAKKYGCSYSRYADDITFSTNLKDFPSEVAAWDGKNWSAGRDLRNSINKAGFLLNNTKTRLSSGKGRQTVTGLTVNRFVNIRKSYFRSARSMCHQMYISGECYAPSTTYPPDRSKIRINRTYHWLSGRYPKFARWYLKFTTFLGGSARPMRRAGRQNVAEPRNSISRRQLEGVISHIFSIKQRRLKKEELRASSVWRIYQRFLLFTRFYDPPKPLIVGEGPTDVGYLRAAIKACAGQFPILAESKEGRLSYAVSFFNVDTEAAEILGLSGGTGKICAFLAGYRKAISKFIYPGKRNPVIFIVDNDSGGSAVYKTLKREFLIDIDLSTGAGITHVTDNIYLLSTDPLGENGTSCIENYFDLSVLSIEIDGRKFVFNKEPEMATEYGKSEFVKKVVTSGDYDVNFSGFAPLLQRMETVIKGYKAPA